MNIIIFGGTGFIGSYLADYLKHQGHRITVVARHGPKKLNHHFALWDGYSRGDWYDDLKKSDVVINVVGKSVDCPKTPDNLDEILRSRVDSVKSIGTALDVLNYQPKLWIQMSTAHIYGDSLTRTCDEYSTLGMGHAPEVGKAWEATFNACLPKETRGVVLRTSFVIGENGGAMQKLKQIARLGLGGKVGHGAQGISWVHEEDMGRFVKFAIDHDNAEGIFNMATEHPMSQGKFMRELRRSMKIPIGLPAPSFLTRFGAKYIFKTDPDMILYGRYVVSNRMEEIGFSLKYNRIEEAFGN
jgi:hypothetical protein